MGILLLDFYYSCRFYYFNFHIYITWNAYILNSKQENYSFFNNVTEKK